MVVEQWHGCIAIFSRCLAKTKGRHRNRESHEKQRNWSNETDLASSNRANILPEF